MNQFKLMSHLGVSLVVISLLFMPIVGCGELSLDGIEILKTENVNLGIKTFFIISILCAFVVLIMKTFRLRILFSAAGLAALIISYLIAKGEQKGLEMKSGAFMAITGYIAAIVSNYLGKTQKENKTLNQEE